MKINLKINFYWNENVSSGLCFILIMLLSLLVAWMAVNAGEEIVNNPPKSLVRSSEISD